MADHIGKPIAIKNYDPDHPDNVQYAKDLLAKHGLTDKETVFDPVTSKHIPGVFVGKSYILKIFKTTDSNWASHGVGVSAICPGGVADDLVDASAGERAGSEKIDPFDIAETALYLACLSPQASVHQIVVDRIGADW